MNVSFWRVCCVVWCGGCRVYWGVVVVFIGVLLSCGPNGMLVVVSVRIVCYRVDLNGMCHVGPNGISVIVSITVC